MPRSNSRRATYQDVLDAPEWVVAEVVDGELITSPRPSPRHAHAETRLASLLDFPFGRGVGGPGGWILLAEPELHFFDGSVILVPDLAAWRRERLPALPAEAYFTLAADWVCEVVSPGTVRLDRERKLPLYASAGVLNAWLVDPLARSLEVLERADDGWLVTQTHHGDELVRAAPFDAVPLALGELWAV